MLKRDYEQVAMVLRNSSLSEMDKATLVEDFCYCFEHDSKLGFFLEELKSCVNRAHHRFDREEFKKLCYRSAKKCHSSK